MALIDVEVAEKIIRERCDMIAGYHPMYAAAMSAACDILHEVPTVDAVPVVHGRWKGSDFIPGMLACTKCGAQRNPNFKIGGGTWNYCPNCGADMRGDGNGK